MLTDSDNIMMMCDQGNWQIKRVISGTGPYTGTVLSDAIRRPHSVPGETRLLWRADRETAGQSDDIMTS